MALCLSSTITNIQPHSSKLYTHNSQPSHSTRKKFLCVCFFKDFFKVPPSDMIVPHATSKGCAPLLILVPPLGNVNQPMNLNIVSCLINYSQVVTALICDSRLSYLKCIYIRLRKIETPKMQKAFYSSTWTAKLHSIMQTLACLSHKITYHRWLTGHYNSIGTHAWYSLMYQKLDSGRPAKKAIICILNTDLAHFVGICQRYLGSSC